MTAMVQRTGAPAAACLLLLLALAPAATAACLTNGTVVGMSCVASLVRDMTTGLTRCVRERAPSAPLVTRTLPQLGKP
jgi:hypothetical protein